MKPIKVPTLYQLVKVQDSEDEKCKRDESKKNASDIVRSSAKKYTYERDTQSAGVFTYYVQLPWKVCEWKTYI